MRTHKKKTEMCCKKSSWKCSEMKDEWSENMQNDKDRHRGHIGHTSVTADETRTPRQASGRFRRSEVDSGYKIPDVFAKRKMGLMDSL